MSKKDILNGYADACFSKSIDSSRALCLFLERYFPRYLQKFKEYIIEEGILDFPNQDTILFRYFREVADCPYTTATFRYWVLEDFLDKVKP